MRRIGTRPDAGLGRGAARSPVIESGARALIWLPSVSRNLGEVSSRLACSGFVDDLDRRRPLVRIHPDHHSAHTLRLLARTLWTIGEEGNATSSWAYPS